ncbi:putative pentatricopeptide repeat-containing protein At1g69350, mitochondrial [Syzygium oleosum]|uniref:putative pentatricopeptide repeat-containing protein At1g69350, mitochondrial n=1 Tax=Syzygium oleosum TaxID=219896 RepID=UPI0011D1DF42|nr:putative pentatricopeptide repeat-containing protein At1g69350, mitochondrial [Syzygium oleosum]
MTLYMPLFRACASLRTLAQLHAHLLVTGLHRDPLASTRLVQSYAEMGSLESSRLVFDRFPAPDSFMWGVLVKCCVWSRSFEQAVSLYREMVRRGKEITGFVYPSVLRACSCSGDLGAGETVHGTIVKCGLDADDVVRSSLLCMYGETGQLHNARKVFDDMSGRDVVSWSSMISSYVDNGDPSGGLDAFRSMLLQGLEPDSVTVIGVAEACAQLGSLCLARLIHGQVVTRNIESDDATLNNSLVVMYSKCGDLSSAEVLFNIATCWSAASWTAMISSYNQSGCFREALDVFLEMQVSQSKANSVTMMAILCSCARLGWLREGQSVHCFVIRNAIDPGYDFLGPALIEFYADCGRVHDSEKTFMTIEERDAVSWNMLITVYARKGFLEEALSIFLHMRAQGVIPDSFSLTTSLWSCGSMGFSQLGCQIHGFVMKSHIYNEFVRNALIDMYSKCGDVDSAYRVFLEIQQRDIVTWNTMICGFCQNGYSLEAIHLFDKMYLNSFIMDEVSFLSVIQACSQLGHLKKGKWVHHKLIIHGVRKDSYIDTALTDMYAKSGDLKSAQAVFDSMPEKTVVSWSAMIAGYGTHGQVDIAISLFNQMVQMGIQPNDITFMNILSACSHAGSVEYGKFYFGLMNSHGVAPKLEHFACLIDLLSRSGNLDEAYSVISSMPFPADSSVWGALINGCRIHQRMDIFQIIQRDLLDVHTDDTGYFTLLSNIHAEEGNWVRSRKLRSTMESAGLKKVPGYSLIELGNRTYKFGAGDISNLQIEEICKLWERNLQNLAPERC